jgi:DNA-binding MarR family transcriptional regulator
MQAMGNVTRGTRTVDPPPVPPAPTPTPTPTAIDVSHIDPVLLRVGKAWGQLRRGGSMLELRQLMYGAADGTGPALDVAQGDALDVILERGPIRMGDLAHALRVDASTATRTVARLAAAGLVERQEGTRDRRVVKIVATERGRELQARMVRTATEVLGRILEAFAPSEAETLATLMERLVESLDAVVSASRVDPTDAGGLSGSS